MKIVMIGEAARHEDALRAGLDIQHAVLALPATAASDPSHDNEIDPADVVISLRLRRAGGAPRFAMLQVPGAGLDGIDLSCLDPETVVTNVSEHQIPIAEFVMARILEWQIRAGDLQAGFSPTSWPDRYRNRIPHGEVFGRTIGLIGFGGIGRAVAQRAEAFGMQVLAVDELGGVGGGQRTSTVLVRPVSELEEMVARSDFVVVACPLTDSTRGLINARILARMSKSAVLINISRAEIVDEQDLYQALQSRVIAGAVLDVWYHYPGSDADTSAPAGFPFWELDNAWCTPHSSAWTTNLPIRRYAVMAENINRLMAGEPLRNVIRAPLSPCRIAASRSINCTSGYD